MEVENTHALIDEPTQQALIKEAQDVLRLINDVERKEKSHSWGLFYALGKDPEIQHLLAEIKSMSKHLGTYITSMGAHDKAQKKQLQELVHALWTERQDNTSLRTALQSHVPPEEQQQQHKPSDGRRTSWGWLNLWAKPNNSPPTHLLRNVNIPPPQAPAQNTTTHNHYHTTKNTKYNGPAVGNFTVTPTVATAALKLATPNTKPKRSKKKKQRNRDSGSGSSDDE